MLDPASRGAIIALSALCVAGGIMFAPTGARGSLDGAVAPGGAVVNAFVPRGSPRVDVQRDPFADEPTSPPARPPAPAAGSSAIELPRSDLDPLPSNLASNAIPAVPTDTQGSMPATRITAIVTGMHPYALLETAGVHEIKGIGDRVSGKPIVAIDLTGVTLAGGARLTVALGDSVR